MLADLEKSLVSKKAAFTDHVSTLASSKNISENYKVQRASLQAWTHPTTSPGGLVAASLLSRTLISISPIP